MSQMKICGQTRQCEERKCRHLTYALAVERAFYDECGRKHSHQRRIRTETLEEFKRKILNLENEVKRCSDFDSIYQLFKGIKPRGIGELTVYDVALGVSTNYGIYPKTVYLHAGTKKGAVNSGLTDKFSRKKQLSRDEISLRLPWLADIEPYLIEDFLCIYKSAVTHENFLEFIKNRRLEKKDV